MGDRRLPPDRCLPPTPSPPQRDPGYTPVRSPCGSGNLLRLWHFCRNSCILHFCGCILYVRLANRILLSSEESRLAQASAALQLRRGGNAGISLLIRQPSAIIMRGGAEAGPAVELGGGARILGPDPATPVLFVAPQEVVHPVAAPANPDSRVKTSSRGRAERAAAARVPSQLVVLLDCPLNLGTVWHACLDHWLFDVHQRSPIAVAHASATGSP